MKIAVIEDNAEDRKALLHLLDAFCREESVSCAASIFDSAEDFFSEFETGSFDLCFLDIYLPGMNGMEAAKKLRAADPACALVFLTISPDFACDGYEVRALRYLVKPLSAHKLREALVCCLTELETAGRILRVKLGRLEKEIPYSQILYATVVGSNPVLFFTAGSITLSTHVPFSEMVEPLLKDSRFFSCGRGIVVNLTQVKNIENRCFQLTGGYRVPISRRKYAEARSRFLDAQLRRWR